MNAIATTAPMPLGDMQTLAVAIAKSALFGIRTPEQALVLMAIAQAEGRHPVEAARDYDIINNRPAKKAEAMLRDFIQAGGKVKWHSLTDEKADATFTHPQTGEVRIDWDMKRAQTAFGKKDMYAKFPRQMLRSRVVSEGVRTLWPLATSGMYEPGEAADIPPEHTGKTIDHEPEPEAPSPAPDARDAINAAVPIRAAAAATPRPPRKTERAPAYDTTADEGGWKAFVVAVAGSLGRASTRAEVEAIAAKPQLAEATATGPDWVKRDLSEMLADAYGRAQTPETDEDPTDEIEIVGERNMAAGDD